MTVDDDDDLELQLQQTLFSDDEISNSIDTSDKKVESNNQNQNSSHLNEGANEFDDYMEKIRLEFEQDTTLTIGNLKDKSLMEAQIKGKWASKLMAERIKGKAMKKNLDELMDKLGQLYDNSDTSYLSSKMQKEKMINANSEVKKLRIMISNNRQVQDMMELYWEVIKPIYDTEVICFNSDEVIIRVDSNDVDNQRFDALVNAVSSNELIDVRIEKFTLSGYEFFVNKTDETVHKLNEFYKRSCDPEGIYKSMPLPFHKILHRLLRGEVPTEQDRIMTYEKKCNVLLMEDITIEKIK